MPEKRYGKSSQPGYGEVLISCCLFCQHHSGDPVLSNPSLIARRTGRTNTAVGAAVFLDREASSFAVFNVRCSFGSLAKNYNLVATIDVAVGSLVGRDRPFLGTPVVNGFTVKGSHTPRARQHTILVICSF